MRLESYSPGARHRAVMEEGTLKLFVFTLSVAALGLSISPGFAVQIFKAEPASGALSRNAIMYVDDGTCPKGEVKKVVGPAVKGGEAHKVLRCASQLTDELQIRVPEEGA